MGTILSISTSDAEGAPAVARAFAEAERLEAIFSLFREGSDVARVNAAPVGVAIAVAPEFAEVARFALDLWRLSEGAFHPFLGRAAPVSDDPVEISAEGFARKRAPCAFDFNGLAKGYVVDRLAALLEAAALDGEWTVNAGGDLRVGGAARPRATLRLGPCDRPILRELLLPAPALATSSPAVAAQRLDSTTRYRQATPLGENGAVAALAGTCLAADALTKVGLFASPEIAGRCARAHGALILSFDEHGDLAAEHGAA